MDVTVHGRVWLSSVATSGRDHAGREAANVCFSYLLLSHREAVMKFTEQVGNVILDLKPIFMLDVTQISFKLQREFL